LVNGDQKRVESPSIKKQPQRYTVVDSQSIVGKNKSSKQVPQKRAGKPSSSKGVVVATKNIVVLETNPGGRGSSRNPFLTKREC